MRKEFSQYIEKRAAQDTSLIFLTGDLGFMALENVQKAMGPRFINTGVSEQNMVSLAAGMASEKFRPLCYSIAPFAVFRPAEQIRNDVCLHHMDVKVVGNGGGYGYGIMGATHHAIEDLAVLSSFQNMICYIPFCNEDVEEVAQSMLNHQGPGYLRLGFGKKPENLKIPSYQPLRQLSSGSSVTVLGIGPVILNAFQTSEVAAHQLDIFVASEIPLLKLSEEFIASLRKTKKLLIIEEHVKKGGLGEHVALMLMQNQISCKISHLHAQGYPNKMYGSQNYHQKISGLDTMGISKKIQELINV